MVRPIQITAVLNGWIVTVGCQTLVYRELRDLTRDLADYLERPDETEQHILETAINRAHTYGALGQAAPAAVPTHRVADRMTEIADAYRAEAGRIEHKSAAAVRDPRERR